MFLAAGNFMLSEWIWSITWGIGHIPINIILMYLLGKFVIRVNSSYLFLLTVLSQIFAIVAFSAIVVGVIVCIIGMNHLPSESALDEKYNVFFASMAIGIIYALLQSLFFYLLSKRFTINVTAMTIIAFLSNITAAQIMYLMFPYK